jgi:hypothetical protein
VLHRLTPAARRLQQDAQVLPDLFLADIVGQKTWSKREVVLVVV